MIGQYVYTRNEGNIIIGPGGNPNVGLGCVARTDSVRQEDLGILQSLCQFSGSVCKPGSDRDYLPHYQLRWLPSGSAAVGRITHFPGTSATKRNNYLAHFFILDPETARLTGNDPEVWFTLPFLDYDLNPPDASAAQEECYRVLPQLQDVETLEEAGARLVFSQPLLPLLESLGMSVTDFRDLVTAATDAAIYQNRQALLAYDCFRDAMPKQELALLSWVFRMIPISLRSRVGFAFPFHSLCNSSNVQFALIPRVNIHPQIGAYRSSDHHNGFQDVGVSYLYAHNRFYHHKSNTEELFRNVDSTFADFVLHLSTKGTILDSGSLARNLEEIQRRQYQEGWHPCSHEMLELMFFSLYLGDSCPPRECYRNRLKRLLPLPGKFAQSGKLPHGLCVQAMCRLLPPARTLMRQDAQWPEILAELLKESPDASIIECCLEEAALTCAIRWAESPRKAAELIHQQFEPIPLGDHTAARYILNCLFTEQEESLQALWLDAGVRCDANAALQRILDQFALYLDPCTGIAEYLKALEEMILPAGSRQTELRQSLCKGLLQKTTRWIEVHAPVITGELLPVLCRAMGDPEDAPDLASALRFQTAGQFLLHFRSQLLLRYGDGTIRQYQAFLREPWVRNPDLVAFLEPLEQSLAERVADRISRSPLTPDLLPLVAAITENGTWNHPLEIYEALCGRILGLLPESAPATFLSGPWLAEMEKAQALLYREGCPNANLLSALSCLMAEVPFPKALGALLSADNAASRLRMLQIHLFRDGRMILPHRQIYNLWSDGGILTTGDLLVLLRQYGPEAFLNYIDWLSDQRHYPALTGLLTALVQDPGLLKTLPAEHYRELMSILVDDFYDGLIPDSLCPQVIRLSNALWNKCPRRNLAMLTLFKEQYLIPATCLQISDSGKQELAHPRKTSLTPKQSRESRNPAAPVPETPRSAVSRKTNFDCDSWERPAAPPADSSKKKRGGFFGKR